MTRESLGKVSGEEFDAFLDDVAADGLKAACESRLWTQGAVLNWISENEERKVRYAGALQVKAEMIAHATLDIADGSDPEMVGVSKLQIDTRLKLAGKWNRERYGERVSVDKTVNVVVDAGLVGFAGELLARLSGPGRVVGASTVETVVEVGRVVQVVAAEEPI